MASHTTTTQTAAAPGPRGTGADNRETAALRGASATSAPSISLPKGGGAIRGMGEKFFANPVTGTGTMTVPIATSPSRSGFGPELALSYDSGAGNGPFGFGWTLSLPAITRKTERGLPQYQDAIDSDVFVLSGAEDLVPEPIAHEAQANGWRVRRYRPRIEGLFARIERWSRLDDAKEVHWRAITRDNVLSVYGLNNDSRIADPQDASRIFSWLICETRDDKGNAVLYSYKADDATNVDFSRVSERNRGPAGDVLRKANRYLKRVVYGNRTPALNVQGMRPDLLDEPVVQAQLAAADWMFELVFDYGDHDPGNPAPNDAQAWAYRSDAFSSYRAGFEIRCTRLCQRALMFHHFDGEAGVGRNCLVRSTNLAYAVQAADPAPAPYNFLVTATPTAYRRNSAGYEQRSVPPLSFEYSPARVQDRVEELGLGDLENLPGGLDPRSCRWADLHGEGSAGLLVEQSGAWLYKGNLSALAEGEGAAQLALIETVALKPNIGFADGAELMDLAGDGQADLVMLEGPLPGLFEHDGAQGWQAWRAFGSLPGVRFSDPNLRFVDLDGDGQADILISEDDAFVWYASLGEHGFAAARRVVKALNEEKGPRTVFFDGAEAVHLADFSGDGLADLVRIRNGDVCYWPNLGYGRFGAKVTMDHSPWFDEPDQFDPQRLRLVDIDGSGTTDIVYLRSDGVRLYFNQSGNGWGAARRLNVFPGVDAFSNVVALDLLGNGTACLVWASPLPGDSQRSLRYVRLMAEGKPHLLNVARNNLGGETHVHYAPSTKFYLQDKRAGKPWVTRLPFPVHVVESVETFDLVSRHRFANHFAYHHGYFDGEEREFRGFGMVEQFDTEAFEDYVVGVQQMGGDQELAPELSQPPVTTRTWYHTGALLDQPQILHQYRHEYYLQQVHLSEPVLPQGLSAAELRECVRALKGLPLRQEVYSQDGTAEAPYPYTVSENNFELRCLQPRGQQRHGVFLPVGRETLSLNYERNPADPRVSHAFGLELDEYGNARKSCSVVYGRQVADPLLPVEVTRDQQQRYITYAEADYTPDIARSVPANAHRLRVPFESRNYEITGIAPAAGRFQFDEIKAKIAATTPIDYEVVADGVSAQKRLLSHSRGLFLDNSLNPLPLGQWDSLGLGHQSYQLAFTPAITAAHYAGKVSEAEFLAAGYVHLNADANWWVPSGTLIFAANPGATFYIPIGAKDPLGLETLASFDKHMLLVEKVEVRQAAWNVTTAVNDYRVLGPVLTTDPNGNRSAVEHDVLGMVVKTAIMGKAGSADGDTLADPSTRMEYELFNWMNNRKPNFVHSFAREQHGAANPRWQEGYAYSNGSGGVAMVKAQAHPGKAFKLNPDGSKAEVLADPRWVGNGRTVLNNKGKPVKQYEPFFSTTHEHEDEKVLREIGVTPVLYYDPVGRNVRTLFPNGTFARVEFNPWLQKVFDANDTVKQSQWYAQRGSPDPTQAEPLNDPERRSAWLAAEHADTPGVTHFDSLGRPVYAVSDYGGGKTAAVRSESDLTGRFSKMFDQAQREVASGFVGLTRTAIVGESAEKGRRWTFQNIFGALVKTWDEHGRQFRAVYDGLHRPASTFVQEAGQAEILFNYVVYGDRLANARQLNLLGTAHQIFDQAGMVRVPELDFKGNPKSVDRILAKDYKNRLDWSALPAQPDVAAVQAAADPVLEIAEVFAATSQYDALNRPTRVALPDGTVILPTYNEANFLASLRAQIKGQGNFIEFLKGQEYDAKGQRQFAHYGNDVFTEYFYDPSSFRLNRLLSYKSNADPQTQGLQDLNYSYDPIGNITQIRDDAQQTHYFSNAVVKPESLYEYDAIYQLIHASGRELAGLGNDTLRTHTDLDFVPLPHANNASAVRNYTEEYEYDLLGNIKQLKHHFQAQPGIGSGWTRNYRYAFDDAPGNRSNRLTATSLPGDPDAGPYTGTYDYDAYGNMTRMPHLAAMNWNFMDQLCRVDLGGGGTAHYVYGLGGQRLRKVIERNGDLKLEWIFLGAVMIFRRRRRDSNELKLERWTVHISDDTGHVAQVDTKTRDDDNDDPGNALNAVLIRYQYTNQLGSAVLETDEDGNPISYEEYHPYGTSAYRSSKPGFELSLKRYRFSGKERDDETGLCYFGARYLAPWLGRWTSNDPAGFVSGLDLYRYCSNNPIAFRDAVGTEDRRVPFSSLTKDVDTLPEFEAWAKGAGISYQGTPEFKGENAKGGAEWYVPKFSVVERGKGGPDGGGGAVAARSGQALSQNNPTGFTKEVPNNFDDAKIKAYKERITDPNDRGVGIRSRQPGTKSATADLRSASEDLRDAYNDSLPQSQRALRGVRDVDHTVELQDIIRGDAPGADTVRPQDHRIQPSRLNSSQGSSNQKIVAKQIAQGAPVDTPAGGVSRTRDIGKFWNKQGFRTGVRWGGYGLAGLGTIYSAYAFGQDIQEGNFVGAALDGTGFVGGALFLGGTAAGSTSLVAAGTVIAAPAAVIGAGLLGWQVGTYIDENTGISDTAMSVGDWAEKMSGSTFVGATFAAGSAIVTSPYYAGQAAGKALGDAGAWLGGKLYDWFN